MAMTLDELKEQMEKWLDEDLICELLGITTVDLIDAFEDRIIKDFDRILEDFKDEY
ncbi:hypothetical protein N9878_02410 [bacterium]|nr:hypothetical protein [bacterium]